MARHGLEAGQLQVTVAPTGMATDLAAVSRLVEIVNAAYAFGEAGMWPAGTARVTSSEIRALISAAELTVARTGEQLVGCVRLHQINTDTWGLGMLATDPARQGLGIGRALIDSVEATARTAGSTTMQLELLVPTERAQPSKELLRQWYSRLGYAMTPITSMARDHPDLFARLAVEAEYQTWHKQLTPAARDQPEDTGAELS